MGSPGKKKVRFLEYEDRISNLPDELVHKILSFLDAKVAVQTSVLSKRWKPIWATLPFLNFGRYEDSLPENRNKFIRHVLYNRNHQSHLSELNLCVFRKKLPVLEKFVEYAISHNVEYLNLDLLVCDHEPYKLSALSSNSLKKLKLDLDFESESDFWDLPALTTLHLNNMCLPDSCLKCLPALKTLFVNDFDFSDSSFSFSLPHLTTLCLTWCVLPETIWDFPALLSLDLYNVGLPVNMTDIFSTLVNLQNLTINLIDSNMQQDHFISCPQLVNLNISANCYVPHAIVVLAPKLSNFSSFGIFSITFQVPELKKVDIKLHGWFEDLDYEDGKKYYPRFTSMLLGLGSARILTFDLESIQALSEISNLVSFPSPFYNLKYVKLPRGYKESSISRALRSYLLGASPGATIVTTLPQNNMIPQTAEYAALQEPLAAPIKGLVDCQFIDKIMSVETVDMGVQEQHVLENSLVDRDRVRPIDSPVKGTSSNRVSSSKGYRDFGLWQGHEVNSEFVCLLDRIMHRYPETFEHFTTKNKKLSTVRLNMLCTSLNEFTKISMTEVDLEIIGEYRKIFAFLQNLRFNLSWVVSRLNYIEHLRFSKPLITELHAIDCLIDHAKSKVQHLRAHVGDAMNQLQNLQTLRAEKMAEIEKDFGTMGTNLAVGFIGDDLLSGP